MRRKKKGKKKQIYTQWTTFMAGKTHMPNFCGPAVGEKIAVGSEPTLAFLLQFVCPIRKQRQTHGKLEKNSAI